MLIEWAVIAKSGGRRGDLAAERTGKRQESGFEGRFVSFYFVLGWP